MAEFKDMLIYYRKSHKMTQRDLASEIGVSCATIGMYESGKRYPSREIEETIADYFNVNLETLRGKEPEPDPRYSRPDESIIGDFIFDRIKNKYIRELYETLGDITSEEGEELINYAKYMVYKREHK